MPPPRHSRSSMGSGSGHHRISGHTLPEVTLGLLNFLLMIWLGMVLVGKTAQHRRTEAFVADLREFAVIFEKFHQQYGAWPAATSLDKHYPDGLEEPLVYTNWSGSSPFGGTYGWNNHHEVTLTAFAPQFPLKLSQSELSEIDRRIDDGNLATGRFRAGYNGWPVYLVGNRP